MHRTQDYHYDLPKELVAQQPKTMRDRSNLLFLRRATGELSHHRFYDLVDFLLPTDTLVLNDTRVIPARLLGRKDTGGRAELLILNYPGEQRQRANGCEAVCQCLIKTSKRPRIGTSFVFEDILQAEVVDIANDVYSVTFSYQGDFFDLLYEIGRVPLPPYIKRETGDQSVDDRTSYQTIYAVQKGAVAAPTAGLHFSKKLLQEIIDKGVSIATITLHVSYGTFLPVRVSDIRQHEMHPESYVISEPSAARINHAKANGNRIVAVGTTCVRAIEFASDDRGHLIPGKGQCNLFIYPGYRFKVVDAMITNFHLPQSTLLMLVSAFAGRENMMRSYKEAIRHRYRFYSYGDAMLIA